MFSLSNVTQSLFTSLPTKLSVSLSGLKGNQRCQMVFLPHLSVFVRSVCAAYVMIAWVLPALLKLTCSQSCAVCLRLCQALFFIQMIEKKINYVSWYICIMSSTVSHCLQFMWKVTKDLWVYDAANPMHLYCSEKASTIVSIYGLPHCKSFYQLHKYSTMSHTPKQLPDVMGSLHRWESTSLGRILISFTVQMHPCLSGCAYSGTSGSPQICDICVLLDVCPSFLKQSMWVLFIHLNVTRHIYAKYFNILLYISLFLATYHLLCACDWKVWMQTTYYISPPRPNYNQ